MPPPSRFIFNYFELFMLDHQCMPHFDMYLEEKEPEMLQYSERAMKLAVFHYDIVENPIEETNVFREKEYSRNRGAIGRGPNTQEPLL